MGKIFVIQESTTVNPAGSPNLSNISVSISPPSPQLVVKQDPGNTEGKFMSDLDRATSNRAKEHLAKAK